ncbi:endophilin-B2-like [Chiloscyllium plagiosum]|uniref:endophilin-B2-like n=1 Tax=Chiloscyllium plagiosum TaxID=36176 RepID=UPI001CB7C844|nr:endophilin-B2-like [Chiloscyllium plagiosum]
MDFNVKKLASDAGVFFSRAVQFTEEKLGQAEKTELDAHFENLLGRADSTKNWTEKILRQTEVLLQPNPSKISRGRSFHLVLPWVCSGNAHINKHSKSNVCCCVYWCYGVTRCNNECPLSGSTLIKVGEAQRHLGAADRDFIQSSMINFLTPLRNFLEGDWKTISKERRLLENRRLDLDACKARLKKAKAAEAKAACEGEATPDFQETRPRNYVLSASASALWSDEVTKVKQKLLSFSSNLCFCFKSVAVWLLTLLSVLPICHFPCRVQTQKGNWQRKGEELKRDRVYSLKCLMVKGVIGAQIEKTNHLRCLHEFVEAQATYYAQCYQYTLDLQKLLSSSNTEMFPGTFVGNADKPAPPHGASPSAATIPVVPSLAGPCNPTQSSVGFPEVSPPSSGTRRARVLYDYDAADSSELQLLADELITVYSLPGMDSDWLMGEKGTKKGKVPVTYLELLN